jgi:hypothetical protein
MPTAATATRNTGFSRGMAAEGGRVLGEVKTKWRERELQRLRAVRPNFQRSTFRGEQS